PGARGARLARLAPFPGHGSARSRPPRRGGIARRPGGASDGEIAMKFGKTRRIHLIGIGGSGMSGIAEVLLNLGYAVTGSDLASGETVKRLKTLGARIR